MTNEQTKLEEARIDNDQQSGRRGGGNPSVTYAIRNENGEAKYAHKQNTVLAQFKHVDKDGRTHHINMSQSHKDDEPKAWHAGIHTPSKDNGKSYVPHENASAEDEEKLKKAIPHLKKAFDSNDRREVAKTLSKHMGKTYESVNSPTKVGWFDKLSKKAQEAYKEKHKSKYLMKNYAAEAEHRVDSSDH